MVNLFFVVNNEFLIHKCENENAEKYGSFLNYPKSHMDIWDEFYFAKYHVDFDFYPRGRVVYNTTEKSYYIYHDKRIKDLENTLSTIRFTFERESAFFRGIIFLMKDLIEWNCESFCNVIPFNFT